MKKLLIIGGIVGAIALFAMYAIGTYTKVRNDGRQREIALSAQWNSMQADYGQFRTGFYDQISIAREKRDAMNKILNEAVAGRYDKGQAGSGAIDGKALINAVREAYPDLGGLDIYDKILAYIVKGRNDFATKQSALQAKVAEYNTWKDTGSFLHPVFAGWLFPSDRLVARVGDKTYKGQEALDKMSKVIVGSDTTEIFDSGEDKPLDTKEKK